MMKSPVNLLEGECGVSKLRKPVFVTAYSFFALRLLLGVRLNANATTM
jgi:hypothetical protein